jgi:hypothetical protein
MRSQKTEKVHELWTAHESVIVRILKGESFGPQEFTRAVDFFERTTGIASHDEGTYVGRLPSDRLQDDLKAWQAWYAANRDFLYWDPATDQLKFDDEGKHRQHDPGSP